MANPPDILAAWQAGFTMRFHAHAHLSKSGDLVAAHSARVALLCDLLFPDASKALIVAAVKHDLGEMGVGDVAGPAKRDDPVLRAAIDRAEAARLAAIGVAIPALTDFEAGALKLCDRLDAWLFAMHEKPWLRRVTSDDYIRHCAACSGVGELVGALLRDAQGAA